ncbi:MAG: tetratricopeptide repeat protein [Elusimicrobiota bacterium]|jgi:tetratricopeptide (TPR) repeat protein
MDAIEKLEAAREALSESPRRALSLLPRAAALPPALRPERDFVEAEALRARGFLASSESLYAGVLSRLTPSEDPVLFIESCLARAAALRSLGRTREASGLLAKAGRAPWARRFAHRLRLERALVLRAEGRHRPALRELRSLLAGALDARDAQEAAFLLWAIGGAERLEGELEASVRSFKRSRTLFRRAGDRLGEGYALFGLAGVSRIRGRAADSERFYARAAAVFSQSEDLFGRAYAFCGRANALRQLGRLDEAERLYRSAYGLYASLGDEVDLAYVVWGQGKILLQRGALAGSRSLLLRALGMFSRGNETRGVVLSELALAQALYALGKVRQAEGLKKRAEVRAARAGLHTPLEVFT